MIPLRILHAVPDRGSLEYLGVGPLLASLTDLGQSVAQLHREDGIRSQVVGESHRIPCDPRWWSWLTGGRKRCARDVALWTPDLIHVHTAGLLPVALDLCRDLSLGLVVSTLTHEDAHAVRRLRDPLISWILVPTEEHRVHLTSRAGIHRDRIAVVPPGATSPKTPRTFRVEAGWRVGAIAARKPEVFAAAVAELQSAGLSLEATLHTGLLGKRARERLTDRTGSLLLDDGPLGAFLATLDVLVLPEAGDHFIPLLVAAQVAGIPVITVASPGITELLQDGETGLVLGSASQEALGDALRSLHDRERRSAMATAALLRAGGSYTAPTIASATLTVYRSCLGQSDSGHKAEVSRTWRRMTDSRLA